MLTNKQLTVRIILTSLALAAILLTQHLLTSCSNPLTPAVQTHSQLQQTISKSINKHAPKISPARQQALTNLLTHIAVTTFDDITHREYWIALIGVESGYDSTARSKAGAIGLGQLLPQFASDFAQGCGLGLADNADVFDDYTNLLLSACFFRKLIEDNGGSIPLALASYNAGSNSPSVKAVKQGKPPTNAETSAYLNKIWISRSHSKGDQQ